MFVLSFQITIGVRLGDVCSQFSDYHWSETWRCLFSVFRLPLELDLEMFVLSFQITIGVRLGNVCSQFSDYHWSETWRCLFSVFRLPLE